jgi:hypothetical protein
MVAVAVCPYNAVACDRANANIKIEKIRTVLLIVEWHAIDISLKSPSKKNQS